MCPSTMPTRKQRALGARLVARKIAKERVPKRKYNLRARRENWLTSDQIFAAADALLEHNIAPTCGAVSRQLGRGRTDNTVRLTMRDYWRDLWERLSSAGVLRC